MDKDKICEAVSQLKYEYEGYHERMIAMLIHEYDDYSLSCERDGTDSTYSDEFKKLLTESDLDKACSKERSNKRYSNFESTNHRILPWKKTLSIRKWTH